MKKLSCSVLLVSLCICCVAQNISEKIGKAYERFVADSQLNAALSSLYVLDAQTGQVVYEKNAHIGLATASTLKIITAATAYELLGKDFRYRTDLAYDGKVENGILNGNLWFRGEGDPSLGSWRWRQTNDTLLVNEWVQALRDRGIKEIRGSLIADDRKFESQSIPDGWIWQDLGNYYGAGCWALNWKENQYEIKLRSGNKTGDSVSLVHNGSPDASWSFFLNELKSAGKGTGDNAYIYLATYGYIPYLRGTIPVNENNFSISGAVPDGPMFLIKDFFSRTFPRKTVDSWQVASRGPFAHFDSAKLTIIQKHYSPSLDSIVYWLLKKSINLYGEALIKTLAFQTGGLGTTDKGVKLVKDFWKEKGIVPAELNIVDGSGLSPLDRVTTHAQVMVLQYARRKSWFPGYRNAFPEYNGMKMKSGTINGVKGFCGYHQAKDGREYIFSFLVNNYNGPSSLLVDKMYRVLDVLK